MVNCLITNTTSMDPRVVEALTALEVAQNRFNLAQGPDMVEAACYEVTAAELRLRAAIKRARADSMKEGR